MNKQKILIVDDEPFNIDYVLQEMEDYPFETCTAVNGKDALEKITAEKPDLILLDIMMPVMDGFEVLAQLKMNEETRDLPVIVISAASDLGSLVRGIKLGAEDFLPKPFEPTLLHARVNSSLEKKHLRDLQKLYLKSLEREMDIAREVQSGFLPTDVPQVQGWQISTYFKAARVVAGDFFDIFSLPDNNLALVVGDVCGKGVGAALFMALFRSLVRATAMNDISRSNRAAEGLIPSERIRHTVEFVNTYLNETHTEAGMFSTLFFGILDPQHGLLTYSNCGNEAPILLRGGSIIHMLKPNGPVVGALPDVLFGVDEIYIQPGDLLLAFTDGIPDAQDQQQQPFTTENILKFLKGFEGSASAAVELLTGSVIQFCSTAEQFDDITLMALKRA